MDEGQAARGLRQRAQSIAGGRHSQLGCSSSLALFLFRPLSLHFHLRRSLSYDHTLAHPAPPTRRADFPPLFPNTSDSLRIPCSPDSRSARGSCLVGVGWYPKRCRTWGGASRPAHPNDSETGEGKSRSVLGQRLGAYCGCAWAHWMEDGVAEDSGGKTKEGETSAGRGRQ